MAQSTKITVEAIVNAPVAKVWKVWNTPADIMQWNTADPSWHCPSSENDLRVGGSFKSRMEAKDGSFGFDFGGVYDEVELNHKIAYTLGDGRQVVTSFTEDGGKTNIKTIFDAETINDPEMQKQGWQSIMNNFVKYVETN